MAAKPLCSVSDCGKSAYCKGYCTAHYSRLKRYGDPLAGRLPNGSALAWIKNHAASQSDDCLEWPFKRLPTGYGVITLEDVTTTAHRRMCIEAHGQPPTPAHYAAHGCHNPPCCNPNHLRWATPSENQMDRVADGTSNRGERQWLSKLKEADVKEIRRMRGVMTQKAIAEVYGVHPETIGHLLRMNSWSWVT